MKEVTVVLGGGGARGLAHIGLLKVLESKNVKIKKIIGCSMGGLIGALYAYGYSASQLEVIAKKVNFYNYFDIDYFHLHTGLAKGLKFDQFLEDYLPSSFSSLKIPFEASALDLVSGEEVFLKSGDLRKAIRATACIPGVFEPIRYGKKLLVDAGFVHTIPSFDVNNFTIVSDVNHYPIKFSDYNNSWKILKRLYYIGQMANANDVINKFKNSKKVIVIAPDLHDEEQVSFKDIDKIIKLGEKASKKKLNKFLK